MVFLGIAFQLCFFSTSTTQAQGSQADTAFLQSAIQHTLATYQEAVGVQTHLYNGTEYLDYSKPHLEGDQFFKSKAVARGDIFYDGTWHVQVPLLYDLVTDEVITPHNSSGLMMKLISAKIDTFQLHGHTYVRQKADSTGQALLQPGFYDLMHNNDIQFLVKRSKSIQERAEQGGMEGEFKPASKFYIRKNGSFHQVSSRRSLYKVFKDKKKQLQKYASSNRLKFRKNKEEAILALAKHYDSLSSEQAQENRN
ncbi:hypothetical protein ACFS7Z_09480 [Pontibacter toksunensis]|uniref:Uncharacterized protein n=1 Tax=Pontibacter toksunensis TaxID=1332631 RepID=A0ABW6BS41_9BACT